MIYKNEKKFIMKKSIKLSALALLGATSISLLGTGTEINTNTTVHAAVSSYWFKKHKVVTKKVVKATEIRGDFLTRKDYVIRQKTLPKGTHLTISHGGSSFCPWAIWGTVHVKGIGKATKKNGNYWTIRTDNTKWFMSEKNWKKQQAKKSKSTKASSKTTFVNHNGNYTYSDKNYTISLNQSDVKANSNSKSAIAYFTFKNRTKKTIAAGNFIPKYVTVLQDGNYLDLKFDNSYKAKNPGWVDMVGHNQTERIPMRVSGITSNSSLTFVFTQPGRSKETGVAIISLPESKRSVTPQKTTKQASTPQQQPSQNTTPSTTTTTTTNTPAQSSSTFTGFPANAGYLEKWNIVKSLQGQARKDAESLLMSEMGLTSNGQPLVSESEFENQITKLSNSAEDAKNWIEHGRLY